MSKQVYNKLLNNPQYLAIFYSLRLKEAQTVFSFDLRSLPALRGICVTLIHINAYNKTIQQRLRNIYGFQNATVKRILKDLVEAGLIRQIPIRRQTNIEMYVTLQAYNITVEGRQTVKRLADLLDAKMAKLR